MEKISNRRRRHLVLEAGPTRTKCAREPERTKCELMRFGLVRTLSRRRSFRSRISIPKTAVPHPSRKAKIPVRMQKLLVWSPESHRALERRRRQKNMKREHRPRKSLRRTMKTCSYQLAIQNGTKKLPSSTRLAHLVCVGSHL